MNSPTDFHETYWEFASQGPFVDIAEDLLGPNVKFHHSKLNFKWSGGGEEVKWHQDIQFWPHTNYQVLTLGVYLDDVTDEMSPMGVIPNSHNGPLYNLYDETGEWTPATPRSTHEILNEIYERSGQLAAPPGFDSMRLTRREAMASVEVTRFLLQ